MEKYVDGQFLHEINCEVVTSNGVIISEPNSAAILLKDKAAYAKRYPQMPHYEKSIAEQKEGHYNKIADSAKTDPSVLLDYTLFVFPEKVANLRAADPTNKFIEKDFTVYRIKKTVKNNRNQDVDMSTTKYLLEFSITKPTKTRLVDITVNTDDDVLAQRIGGLSIANTP